MRTPDAGVFWRVIEDHRVNCFFVAPTAFRAIKKEDRTVCSSTTTTSHRCAISSWPVNAWTPPTYHWLCEHLDVPVIDHWWQTETGWPMCANLAGVELMETRPGSPTLPVPGYDLRILDEDGR